VRALVPHAHRSSRLPFVAIVALTAPAAAATTTAAATRTTTTTAATTAAAAARTTAPESTTTAAARAAWCALCRSVDANRASVELLTIHGADGFFGSLNVLKRHETETARTSGFTICYYVGFRNDTKRFKRTAKAVIISGPGETANKELIAHLLSLSLMLSR
jgi:hypothetical protein